MIRPLAAALAAAVSFFAISAAQAENHRIFVRNKCVYPIELFMRVNDGDGWRNFGWWKFSGEESALLNYNGTPLYHGDDYVLYHYAHSATIRKQTEGDFHTTFEGKSYSLSSKRELKYDDDGNILITYTCDGYLGD